MNDTSDRPRECMLFDRPESNYVVPDEVIDGILADPAQPLGRIARIVPNGARIIDVGCGNGNLGRVLARAGWSGTIDGVEPNAFAAQLAREHYGKVYEDDIAELVKSGLLGEYDFLILADVIEHIANPFNFLMAIDPLVARGTKIVLSVPNVSFGAVRLSLLNGSFDYVDSGLLEKTHVRFLTLKTLLQLFSDLGWGIEQIVRLQRSFFQVEFDPRTTVAEESVLRRLAADEEARTYQHLLVVSGARVIAPAYSSFGATEADVQENISHILSQLPTTPRVEPDDTTSSLASASAWFSNDVGPKVSICIPTYKQIEFLRRTLSSIVEQTFEDYEVVVSDDTPDDSIERLLTEFEFKGRLHYVRNSLALGSPRNWNAALRLAKGEYIKILHHDDYFVSPDSLARFVSMLDSNPEALLAFGGTRVENVVNGEVRHHTVDEAQAQSLKIYPERLFFGNMIGAPSATIVRRSLGIQYDTRMKWLVDLDYYITAIRAEPAFAYTSEILIATPTSAIHQVTEQVRDDAVVDLGEALMLFEKCFDRLSLDPNTREVWVRLLSKYRVQSVGQLDAFGRVSVAMRGYLNELYATDVRLKGSDVGTPPQLEVPVQRHDRPLRLKRLIRALVRRVNHALT